MNELKKKIVQKRIGSKGRCDVRRKYRRVHKNKRSA